MKKFFNRKLKKMIDNSEIVSFDIFDTLIKRNCSNPFDIFKIVEKKYNLKNKTNIEFFKIRIAAEDKARKLCENGEVTLEEIYNQIDFSEDVKDILKEMEIQTEMDFCQVNYDIFEVYKYCKNNKKKVIAISNMYLSKEILKRILLNANYKIDDLFVSCEYRSSKQNGVLFEKVFSILGIPKNKILHIGDSFKADYLGAKCAGIAAYKISRNVNYMSFYNYNKIIDSNYDESLKIILSVVNNNSYLFDNYYSKLGFEIIGPICLQFANWVNNIKKQEKIENLLFCARDMKLINDAYKILFKKDKFSYFYVSRRSTYLPYLYKKNDYESFRQLLPNQKKNTSIEEIFNILNIDVDMNAKLKKYNLNKSKKYNILDDIFCDKKFEEFYNNELIKYIKSVGKHQYDSFIDYLNSLHINKKTALVDLGWRGSTQKILMQILDKKIDGMYFGLAGKHKEIENNCFTFLFNEKQNKYYDRIYPAEEIIELIFSSLEGTTMGYTGEKEKPYVLKESLNEGNIEIEKIQSSALEFIKIFSKYNDYINISDNNIFIDKLIDIICNPTMNQAVMLGNLYSEDYKIKFIAKPQRVYHYIFKPKSIFLDFADASWKVGFLKRFLKIKLPYFYIYRVIKKIKYGK